MLLLVTASLLLPSVQSRTDLHAGCEQLSMSDLSVCAEHYGHNAGHGSCCHQQMHSLQVLLWHVGWKCTALLGRGGM